MPGVWTPLDRPPLHPVNLMLLLTDGRVMAFEPGGTRCSALVPDQNGSYIHGSWVPLHPMRYSRLYFGSAVLADGRVIVTGGEYGRGNDSIEIYDPVSDSWSAGPLPPWPYISDEPCCLLADGRLLAGFVQRSAVFDPRTGLWTEVSAPMSHDCYETTWTLLPDGSVLQPYMLGHPAAQRFLPGGMRWVDAGNVPADLVPDDFEEIGPALLLYDGRVLEVGASGHTDFYLPPTMSGPGGWTVGPDLPDDGSGRLMTARDAPACLLPNGRALVAVGPTFEGDGENRGFSGPPTRFFELTPEGWVPAGDPDTAASAFTYQTALLLLPTGEALLSTQSDQLRLYTPNPADGGSAREWRPSISACLSELQAGATYTLYGRQLNGLSQAVSYGDDLCAATNYPLVRLTSEANGTVRYCRTHDHSSMGVASIDGWTQFDVPGGLPAGHYRLEVVANGIPSDVCEVKVIAAPSIVRRRYDSWFVVVGLADGKVIEIRPHGGPVPVDPFPHESVQLMAEALVAAVGERAQGQELVQAAAQPSVRWAKSTGRRRQKAGPV